MKRKIKEILERSPGLTGREISKQLGENKKTVNSFLNQHRDVFRQDDDYRWYNNSEVVIEFPAGWVTAEAYESALAYHTDLFQNKRKIKFTFPEKCSLLLEPMSRFLALVNQLDLNGVEVTIDLDSCKNTLSFLNRAGFFDLLSKDIQITPKRPGSSTAKIFKGNADSLVELGSICPNSRNKELIMALHSSFIRKTNSNYDMAAFTVFSEFIGNVSEHSESELEGFAALQIYNPPRMRSHIQTVISDSGLGVVPTLRSTLHKFYPTLHKTYPDTGTESDIGLVLEVFSKGRVTRHGKESGRGLGFESTREQASKFDADLSIRLENFCVTLPYRNGALTDPIIQKSLTKMKGTHICFDFFID
ncbi:MAG: ATP-binding protein [Thalassolituus sp.]|nr:MAG: ATP-binding protein [Thalassolituus sp.]